MSTEIKNNVLTDAQKEKLGKIREDIDFNSDAAMQAASNFMDGLQDLIYVAGDTPERNGLAETPFRVFKAFMEYTKGYQEDPREILGKSFDVFYDELVLIKDIPFNSLCEHHFAPFFGKAHVAYIPKNNVITGLSKFARLTDAYDQTLLFLLHRSF